MVWGMTRRNGIPETSIMLEEVVGIQRRNTTGGKKKKDVEEQRKKVEKKKTYKEKT